MKYFNLTFLIKGIALLAMLVSVHISAQPVKTVEFCEKNHQSVVKLSQCLDIVKDHSEKVLQTWVNNQTFILEDLTAITGRFSALKMFKRSHKSFISYRENNCRWQYLAKSPSPSAAPAYKTCFILITNDRIKELSTLKNEYPNALITSK